jgi:hypothetical protein
MSGACVQRGNGVNRYIGIKFGEVRLTTHAVSLLSVNFSTVKNVTLKLAYGHAANDEY